MWLSVFSFRCIFQTLLTCSYSKVFKVFYYWDNCYRNTSQHSKLLRNDCIMEQACLHACMPSKAVQTVLCSTLSSCCGGQLPSENNMVKWLWDRSGFSGQVPWIWLGLVWWCSVAVFSCFLEATSSLSTPLSGEERWRKAGWVTVTGMISVAVESTRSSFNPLCQL